MMDGVRPGGIVPTFLSASIYPVSLCCDPFEFCTLSLQPLSRPLFPSALSLFALSPSALSFPRCLLLRGPPYFAFLTASHATTHIRMKSYTSTGATTFNHTYPPRSLLQETCQAGIIVIKNANFNKNGEKTQFKT